MFPSNALNNEINYILFVFKNFKMNLLSRFRFYFFTILHLHIFVYLCIKWDALCLFHYWLKDFVLDFYCISIKQFSLSCMWVSNDCRIIGTVLLTDLHLQKLRWTHLWHWKKMHKQSPLQILRNILSYNDLLHIVSNRSKFLWRMLVWNRKKYNANSMHVTWVM